MFIPELLYGGFLFFLGTLFGMITPKGKPLDTPVTKGQVLLMGIMVATIVIRHYVFN